MSGWLPGFLIAVAPLALLVSLLLLGRYPGERAIERFHRVLVGWFGRPRPLRARTRPAFPPLALVRGGHLIARSMAGRAPPQVI